MLSENPLFWVLQHEKRDLGKSENVWDSWRFAEIRTACRLACLLHGLYWRLWLIRPLGRDMRVGKWRDWKGSDQKAQKSVGANIEVFLESFLASFFLTRNIGCGCAEVYAGGVWKKSLHTIFLGGARKRKKAKNGVENRVMATKIGSWRVPWWS